MNNSLIDGFNLFWIGTSVVFVVLIVLLVSINILTFIETKFFQKDSANKKIINQENDDNLMDIAAAIAVSIYKKSKSRTNEIAAAVAVSLYQNNKSKRDDANKINIIESSWITINRSRMMHKKTKRV